MSEERRYREDEVAEIFEAAASERHPAPGANALATGEGLTLAELQAIGGEVGIPADRIAGAAAALELRRSAVRRTDLWMPVAVRRTVELPRAPTDREWEVLVAELRETFNARGHDRSSGGLREWSNGNLHARVEPTETGHRLRLGTTMGNGVALNRVGALGLLMAVVMLMVLALSGTLPESLFLPLMMIAMSGGALGYNAARLPGWAREREEQMERVAARAVALLGGDPAPGQARAELAGAPRLSPDGSVVS